MKNKEHIRN